MNIQKARLAHNLFILNLFFFHLLATPAVIFIGWGLKGLLIPLIFSLSLIAWIYLKSRYEKDEWVRDHWRLAWLRSRWLLLGYGLTAAILLLAEWFLYDQADHSMAHILLTVITRIAIMPTLIAVMITIVLEAAAAGRAAQGLPAFEKL